MPQAPVFQRPHNIGLAPTEPQGVRCTTPLSIVSPANNDTVLGVTVSGDLVMEDQTGAINNIQSIFVDASSAPCNYILYFPETQQTLEIPALSQGYYPIMVSGLVQWEAFAIAPPAGTNNGITIQFLNVPVSTYVWRWEETALVAQNSNTSGAALNIVFPALANNVGTNALLLVDGIEINAIGDTTDTSGSATLTNVAAGYGSIVDTLTFNYPISGGYGGLTRTFFPPLRIVTNTVGTLALAALPGAATAYNGLIRYHLRG